MLKRLAILALAFVLFPVISPTALIQTELSYNPRNAKGLYPFVTYFPHSGQVNLVNGNLIYNLPIFSRKGRAGFDLGIGLIYNSKIWDRSGNYMVVKEPGSRVGLGWRMEFPKLVQGTSSYAIVGSDGSSHEIQDYGSGAWKSVDSTYTNLDTATKTATLTGGTRLIFGNTIGNTSYMTSMVDRNGNKITVTYVSGTSKISSITDTLGSSLGIYFYYNADGTLNYIQSLGGTNEGETYFEYATPSLKPSFSITSQIPSGQKILKAVSWDDGSGILFKQYFNYNNYGELTSVYDRFVPYYYNEFDERVEGTPIDVVKVQYTFSTKTFYDAIYGSVEERCLTYINQPGPDYTASISYEVDATKSNPSSVTVQEGGKSTYNFHYTSNGRDWSDGLIYQYQRKTYSDQVLRTINSTWIQDSASSYLVNPRVSSQTATLDNSLSTQTDYTYATDGTGNVKQVVQRGFNNVLLRTTNMDYWHETNSGYANLNLTNLVSEVSILDGNGVEISNSETTYDEFSLVDRTGITQRDPAYGISFATRGNPTTGRKYYYEGSRYISTTTHYDVAGNVVSVTDPLQHATSISYLSTDNFSYPKYVTNSLGHVVDYYFSLGRLWKIKDPNNKTLFSRNFDRFGRMTFEWTQAGTETTYYGDEDYLTTLSSAAGILETTRRVDGLPIKYQQSDPVDEEKIVEQYFNAYGQLTGKSAVYLDGSGSESILYIAYDALHRPTQKTSYGATTTYSYYGNEATVNPPQGLGDKKTIYNEDGKIVKVTEEDDNGNLTVETTYQYDSLGRLIAINQGAQTRTFVYDSLGRLTSETHPESGTTSYTYDDNGNLLTKTDARNVSATMTYDAINRQLTRSFSDSTPGHTFSYDQTTSPLIGIIMYGIGRQTSAWTSDGIGYSWSFDESGRPTQQTSSIDSTLRTVAYNYTDSGCGCSTKDLVSMTYPDNTTISYTRDDISRITQIANGSYKFLRSAAYGSASGALSEIVYGNYYHDEFEYLTDNRLDSIELILPGESHGYHVNYSYNTDGSIDGYTESYNDNGTPVLYGAYFDYDKYHRLTHSIKLDLNNQSNIFWHSTWSYDRYGNMLSVDKIDPAADVAFSLDANTNRLVSSTNSQGTTNYSYSNGGHLINDTEKSYAYNANGLLTEVRRNADYALLGQYRYDAMGRRVVKSWDYSDSGVQRTGSTIYAYGAGGELLAEYLAATESNGTFETSTTDNILMGSTTIARWNRGTNQSGQIDMKEYLHRNHLDEAMTYQAGSEPQFSHEPFGSSGADQFQGVKDDAETGLHYNLARNYSPPLLRWTTADSLTAHIYDPQSLNKYAYVRNDPVNLVDRDGRLWNPLSLIFDLLFDWASGGGAGMCFGPGCLGTTVIVPIVALPPTNNFDWWKFVKGIAIDLASKEQCKDFLIKLFTDQYQEALLKGRKPEELPNEEMSKLNAEAKNSVSDSYGNIARFLRLNIIGHRDHIFTAGPRGANASINVSSNTIDLWRGFFSQASWLMKGQTVLGEMVHRVMGWAGDLELAEHVGYEGDNSDIASQELHAIIREKCK